MHTFNPSAQEAGAGEGQGQGLGQRQMDLYDFQASQGYLVRSCLKANKKAKQSKSTKPQA